MNRYYYLLNIGLSRNDGKENTVAQTLAAIGARCQPFELFHKLAIGEWEGKPENSLACRVELRHKPSDDETREALEALAVDLAQDAIAYAIPSAFNGLVGRLYGSNPKGWTFDKALFHTV